MEFISKYGSSPVDRGTVIAKSLTSDEEVSVKLDGEEPVVNVFKTISEAHVGDLSFFRVYSGSVFEPHLQNRNTHLESQCQGLKRNTLYPMEL